MVDIGAAFVAWGSRLPAGRRVGICTASGGGGGWMADACTAVGLDVPTLDAATRASIDQHLPSYGTSQNPVDATAQAMHKIGYAGLTRLVGASPVVDGLIVVMTGRNPANLEKQRESLTALAAETAKPILMWTYTLPAPASIKLLSEAGYPLYTELHNCARAMRAMADYRAQREQFLRVADVRTETSAPHAGFREVSAKLASAGPVLCEWEARSLLATYGIGAGAEGELANSADAAVAAAQKTGAPVALKVQSPDLPHKTEAGAVALNLASPEAVRAAYERVLSGAKRHAPGARILGVLVQAMAPPGREMIVGIKRDATFGPMLMVGLGGVQVEVYKDVALGPAPLTVTDARGMLARLQGAPLLGAFRGRPAADIDALADLMVRLGRLAADNADTIAEIDLNPVLVHEEGRGVSVVDALIVTCKAELKQPRITSGR
jgi:acyl-CoA synthetase (NDP forming)